MRDINNSRWPDQTSELGSKVSDVVNKSAKRVWDIITLSTLDYKIIELLEISGQKFARVWDDKEEETYLIFKDWEYRDFILIISSHLKKKSFCIY